MVDVPERIWVASVTENYGEWQTTTDGLPHPTEYVRADLYAALEAQLAEANEDITYWIEMYISARHDVEMAEQKAAIEASPPAPKVADGVIDELRWITQNLPIDFVMHERCPVDTLMHVIGTLTAAQEAGK